MIYLVGGAPRAGKSILGQQIAAKLRIGWKMSSVFLGCSNMTLERFDKFPGRSRGYASLPDETRRQFAEDVPLWSGFVRQESERFGYPYVDMIGDFPSRLSEADAVLTAGPFP
jgi:hypothetical protein